MDGENSNLRYAQSVVGDFDPAVAVAGDVDVVVPEVGIFFLLSFFL
jgi:hypothetical protein